MTNPAPVVIPSAEKKQLTLGYMRLTDAAPLIVAQELGFFSQQGLDITLTREMSWANIRDKLIVGSLDGAQILAQIPITTTLGAGGIRCNLMTGLALNSNANAITISTAIDNAISHRIANWQQASLTAEISQQRAIAIIQHMQEKGEKLTFATTHTFSPHNALLDTWLSSAGVNPSDIARIIVLPPEQMVDSLGRGTIDGFCAGEPWNTIAINYGLGAIQGLSGQLSPYAADKVFAVNEQWHQHHPSTHLRLRVAIMHAIQWLQQADNRIAVSDILSRPEYLDIPAAQILPALTGMMKSRKDTTPQPYADLLHFGNDASGFPWRCDAEQVAQSCATLLGQRMDTEQIKLLAQQCYRPTLFREAARYFDNLQTPEKDYRKA